MGFHEVVASDEDIRFERYAKELEELRTRRDTTPGSARRILHLKQHIGAVGELVVNAQASGKVGVFSEDGHRWPVYARFSNGSIRQQRDRVPDVRGFAIKLLGVTGRKLIAGLEDAQTQDFLLINTPSIAFRDPDEFVAFARAAKDGPRKMLPRVLATFGLWRTLAILKRLATMPKVRSFATHDFHTAAPIAFGDTAAKLALFPAGNAPGTDETDESLRDDLVRRLKSGPLRWSVRAKLFIDDEQTPIEDTSVSWPGPWVELGTLILYQQEVESDAGRALDALVEELSFDPWHAIEAHRPLGGIMRARAIAYRDSAIGRKAASELTVPVPELRG